MAVPRAPGASPRCLVPGSHGPRPQPSVVAIDHMAWRPQWTNLTCRRESPWPSVPKSYISSVSRSATTTHVPAEVRGPRRVELGHPAAPLSMPQRGSSMDLRLSNESRLSNIVIKGRAIRQCYTVGTQKPNGSTHVEFKSDEFANGPERLATRPGISGLGFRGMAASRCAASSSPAHSDHACLAGAANLPR